MVIRFTSMTGGADRMGHRLAEALLAKGVL